MAAKDSKKEAPRKNSNMQKNQKSIKVLMKQPLKVPSSLANGVGAFPNPYDDSLAQSLQSALATSSVNGSLSQKNLLAGVPDKESLSRRAVTQMSKLKPYSR